MAEAQECCILGICCDPTLRLDALAMKLQDELKMNKNLSEATAAWIRQNYDLTPKGLIQPLIDYVAAEAREYPCQQS